MMRLRRGNYIQESVAGAGTGTSISMLSVIWYVLGAIVLGALLAKWSWILLKSPATVAAIVPDHQVSENAGRLFGVAAAGSPEVAAAALPNVKLVGVFASSSGQSGFAVLQLDEQNQVGAVVGENVAPGVKLLEVHADHVVLERSGVQQQVELVKGIAGGIGTGIMPAGK